MTNRLIRELVGLFRRIVGTDQLTRLLFELKERLDKIEPIDASTGLKILLGTPYSKYAIPLDYIPSMNFEPRYGYSKPKIEVLDHFFEKHVGDYREFLKFMRTLDYSQIALTSEETDGQRPAWLGAAISPFDSMALYAMVCKAKPAQYLEIGSGMSTRFARQAIRDSGFKTRIVSVDPNPRCEIDQLCDEVIRDGLETCDLDIFKTLEANDILFLDGSHRSFMNSDVTVFFIDILPKIRPGVIVHIHDIVLPYDYHEGFKYWYWNEQYLLAVWLMSNLDLVLPLLPTAWINRSPILFEEQAKPFVDLGDEEINKAWLGGGSMWFTKLG